MHAILVQISLWVTLLTCEAVLSNKLEQQKCLCSENILKGVIKYHLKLSFIVHVLPPYKDPLFEQTTPYDITKGSICPGFCDFLKEKFQ